MFAWKFFSIASATIKVSTLSGYYFMPKIIKKAPDKAFKSNLLKAFLYLMLLNVLFLGHNFNSLWVIYIFGIITILWLFSNLTRIFIKKHKNIKFGLMSDFIIGIVITVYLLYKIPNDGVYHIVLSIIGPVYGGFITLAGVVLTIRYNIIRDEKKHLLSIRPIIVPTIKKGEEDIYFVSVDVGDVKAQNIILGNIKLLDKSDAFIEELFINNSRYVPFIEKYLEKGSTYKIEVSLEIKIDKIESIILHLKDIEYNDVFYEIKMNGSHSFKSIKHKEKLDE